MTTKVPVELVSLDGGIVINESSADADFRVESNGNANMLFVNGGDDRVGIGADPTQGNTLEIYGNSDGNVNALGLWNASDAGTNDSVSMNMYLTGSGGTASAATIFAEKVEDWSSGTSRSASLRFNVRRDGTDDLHLVLGSLGDGLYGARLPNGVRFGSDTATANSLDDYEEGTWTPTVGGNTAQGSTSSGSVAGKYIKIGKLVFASFSIVNITVASASGHLKIGGFPFNNDGTNDREAVGVMRVYGVNIGAFGTYGTPLPAVNDDTNTAFVLQSGDDAAWNVVQVSNDSGQYFEGSITYIAT